MSTKEFIQKQQRIVQNIVKDDKPLFLAVKSVMALQSRRIFLEGKSADGGNIGEYSDKPLYVNPKNSPKKFATKGKNGDKEFKNGEPHKTGYFENYLAFKKAIGRNKRTSSVDLILSGELSRDWANAETLSKANATKITPHHYIVGIKDHNAVKVERYDNVFNLSKDEKQGFIKVLQRELGGALRNDTPVN